MSLLDGTNDAVDGNSKENGTSNKFSYSSKLYPYCSPVLLDISLNLSEIMRLLMP